MRPPLWICLLALTGPALAQDDDGLPPPPPQTEYGRQVQADAGLDPPPPVVPASSRGETLEGSTFHDPWSGMSEDEVRRLIDEGYRFQRGDLISHYWIPRLASYVLPDAQVARFVEWWEDLESAHGFPIQDEVDATDIFAGYAAIRDEPPIGEYLSPEHYPTIVDFFAAYPQLLEADPHGGAVGRVLDEVRRRPGGNLYGQPMPQRAGRSARGIAGRLRRRTAFRRR